MSLAVGTKLAVCHYPFGLDHDHGGDLSPPCDLVLLLDAIQSKTLRRMAMSPIVCRDKNFAQDA